MHHLRKRSETLTVHLFGGLGNQLFQIAAGLHLSEVSGQKLEVTIKTSIAGKFVRNTDIELIGALIPGIKIIHNDSKNANLLRLSNYVLRKFPLLQKALRIHTPKEIGYSPDLVLNEWNELRGHYQTHIFAKIVADRLLHLNLPSTEWFKQKSTEITSECNSVAIHYRRGDYVNLANQYGLLTPEYFDKSIKENFKDVSNLKIYIFSDEPEIAQQDLGSLFPNGEVLKPPRESTALESMLLMATCRNIISSNSTFSWWAGALKSSIGLIIAPDPWMKNGVVINELIPSKWKLSSAIWGS